MIKTENNRGDRMCFFTFILAIQPHFKVHQLIDIPKVVHFFNTVLAILSKYVTTRLFIKYKVFIRTTVCVHGAPEQFEFKPMGSIATATEATAAFVSPQDLSNSRTLWDIILCVAIHWHLSDRLELPSRPPPSYHCS